MNKLFGLIIGILFAINASAFAYPQVFPGPSLNGPTGIVRVPSAHVVPYKNFNVGIDYGTTITDFSTSEGTIRYKMNLGTFHGVEIGIVGGTKENSQQLREGVFVNMKLALSTGEDPYPLLLAMGVENLFSYDQTDVYMVATKYLKQGPKLTFGFLADFLQNKFRPLGAAGIELPLGDTFIITSDLLAGETLFQANAGAQLYFTPIFSVNLYALNILNGSNVKDNRAALIGFSWANPF